MGRKKRGYVREIPTDELKRDYRLFAIACEGSKREKEYFQQFEGISRRVIVEYIEDEEYKTDPPSSPEHVLRRAIEYAENAGLNDEDSIWLVMDVDKWGNKVLNDVHDECSQRKNWNIILSNPCFEIWLLYHTVENLNDIQIATGKDCKMWVYGLDYNPETLEYSVAEYIYTNHINADNFNITGVTKENIKEFKRPENFDWYDDYLKSDINVSSFARPCFLFEWSFDYGEEIVLPLDDGRFYAFHDIWPNELGYDFHDRYLRFNHNGNLGDMNGLWWPFTDGGRESQFFTVAVNFKPYKYYYSHPRSHLVFETVSDDLDKYYSDVLMNDMATDLTLVWGRYHVHSNIKNGKGIFGAVYRSRSPWCYPGNYFYLD